MIHRARWRVGALASAIALLGSFASLDALALGLGRISVQSALGEPLRAEIDIAEISAEETASLRASVASPDAFKAAGLEYTTGLVDMQISLQKRPDGRAYLRLSSTRSVTEPFVDLILEAKWASGRILRDYTMLFDPPSLRQAGAAGATAPVTAPLSAPQSPRPRSSSVPPATVAKEPVAKAPPAQKTTPSGQQVAVKPGDTAGKIAAENKPADVSLDQMLVALLRSNPDAFVGGNVNRLKSGVLLDMPGPDAAGAVPVDQASRSIVAQARDFNEFRRKLAESVPATQVDKADRQTGGKLQAKVEDRAPATSTPDKLTLSKGAVQAKADAEDKIAKARESKQAAERTAELAKNIGDLNKLAAAPAGVPSPVLAASSANATALALAKPAVLPAPPAAAASAADALAAPVATASAPVAVASAPVSAASQAAAASDLAAAALAKKPVAAAPAPLPEPSLLDELTDNPFVLPGLAGLLALLAGLGLYRYKKRNNSAQIDSSFLESRLQPDSFFGASGGQRIDTNEGGTGTSMVYSPSQLDAAGDVDPVAEADVYLAYGRDLQAEEILKEAMRTSPGRVAIHAKLMEIYAKRRDVKAFEVVALEAFNLTRGEGPEWAYIGEMGRELDPTNPMYLPGGQPVTPGAVAAPPKDAAFGSSTIPHPIAGRESAPSMPVDLDLDLDFSSASQAPASAPASSAPARQAEPVRIQSPEPAPAFDGLEMDFSLDTIAMAPTAVAPAASSPAMHSPATAARPAPAPVIVSPDEGMMEFDLTSLSLDLNGPSSQSPDIAVVVGSADDPIETKFALAEEFRALGDMDGARSLAEEVLAQASGSLKSKARAFLNALS